MADTGKPEVSEEAATREGDAAGLCAVLSHRCPSEWELHGAQVGLCRQRDPDCPTLGDTEVAVHRPTCGTHTHTHPAVLLYFLLPGVPGRPPDEQAQWPALSYPGKARKCTLPAAAGACRKGAAR